MADEIELLRLVSELIPEPTTDAWNRARAAVATARDEDLVLQDAQRSARYPRERPGMARRVALRDRRGMARRSVAAVTVALAAAAVVVAAIELPGAGHHSRPPGAGRSSAPGPTVDAAYVVKRVDRALSAAGSGEIAHMTVTTTGPGGTTSADEWSYGQQWRAVRYSPAGHPVYDDGLDASADYTLVNYQARTWARQRGAGGPAAPALGQRGCEQAAAGLSLLLAPGLPGIGLSAGASPATVAGNLRTAISCGSLTVAGHQRVDGIEATKLTSKRGSLISETIWVSPASYLPVRVVIHPAVGSPVRQQAADITWLPPTAQNRAQLAVPIPAGFHQVALSGAGKLVP
jgi:hypothetical protein